MGIARKNKTRHKNRFINEDHAYPPHKEKIYIPRKHCAPFKVINAALTVTTDVIYKLDLLNLLVVETTRSISGYLQILSLTLWNIRNSVIGKVNHCIGNKHSHCHAIWMLLWDIYSLSVLSFVHPLSLSESSCLKIALIRRVDDLRVLIQFNKDVEWNVIQWNS